MQPFDSCVMPLVLFCIMVAMHFLFLGTPLCVWGEGGGKHCLNKYLLRSLHWGLFPGEPIEECAQEQFEKSRKIKQKSLSPPLK